MKSFFDDDEYIIDASSSIDVILYIQAMHPRLGLFMKQAQAFETFEDFCFLDSKGKQVDNKTLAFHKFKDNDTVYVAPMISGGGGRTGTIIIAAALIAVAIAAGQIHAVAIAAGQIHAMYLMNASLGGLGTGVGTVSAASLGINTGGIMASLAASSIAPFMGIVSSVAMSVGISLAMSALQQQVVAAPQAQRTASTRDSGTRSQNDMFGSLSNTSKADSPVALNYGNMRVAGQFLSGYILSQQHAQNDAPTVASIFNANQSPLSAEAEEAA